MSRSTTHASPAWWRPWRTTRTSRRLTDEPLSIRFIAWHGALPGHSAPFPPSPLLSTRPFPPHAASAVAHHRQRPPPHIPGRRRSAQQERGGGATQPVQSPLCHETRADGQSAPHARGKREWLPSRSGRGGRARGRDQPSPPRERLCTLPDHAGPSSAELAQEPPWTIAFFSAWSSAVGATGGPHFQCNPLYRVRKCHVPAPKTCSAQLSRDTSALRFKAWAPLIPQGIQRYRKKVLFCSRLCGTLATIIIGVQAQRILQRM